MPIALLAPPEPKFPVKAPPAFPFKAPPLLRVIGLSPPYKAAPARKEAPRALVPSKAMPKRALVPSQAWLDDIDRQTISVSGRRFVA